MGNRVGRLRRGVAAMPAFAGVILPIDKLGEVTARQNACGTTWIDAWTLRRINRIPLP
jgi:hypothetical protein